MPADLLDTSGIGEVHDSQLDYYAQRTAVASSDSCVYIFDVVDGRSNRAVLKGHEGPVWKVAWAHPKFGMNRSSVVASCSYDMKVIVWKEANPGQWQIAHCDTSHAASVNSLQFCPWEFGLRLACASSDGSVSVLSHSPQDQMWYRKSFDAHACGAQEISWAPAPPAGSEDPVARIATGGCDCAVKIWRLENECWSLEQPQLPIAHRDWVRSVAWRQDDVRTLASGGWDKTVIIWEQESVGSPSRVRQQDAGGDWRKVAKIEVNDKVEAIAWSETGGVLAVSSADGETVLYKETADRDYVEVAKVSEAGLKDVPNTLGSSLAVAEVQVSGPKVSLEAISPGDGITFPKKGDMLTMHYVGKIAATGAKFDSSHDRQKPFEFQIGLGKVIDGWDQGVIQMSLGQKALLKVPYTLGYGEEGAGDGVIPPSADLLFEVELLKIN